MNSPKPLRLFPVLLLLFATTLAHSARANVYASNIKLNGGLTNATTLPVTISYILNEPASLGVTVKILLGSTVVRTITITNGPGTALGTNTVIWDGNNDSSSPVGTGTYSVSVKAASSGYGDWTQISSDTNNYVWEGRGIAVDRNPSSLYYGRVFVGNADTGPGIKNGDLLGIQKLNADGSPADEGGFSTGGFSWFGGTVSPWKIEVSADDFVYIGDFSSNGEVYRWDPTLSTNSLLDVLREDNWGNSGNVDLSGPFVFGSGPTTQIWMADINLGGLGVLRYNVTADGTCASNYYGVTVVGIGGDTNLTSSPYDVALDQNGTIYTIQSLAAPEDPAQRVFRFPAYNPSTNGPPETNADWAIGGGNDEYAQASGIAVDPSGTYVAVSFRGVLIGNQLTNGNTKIFYATNGAVVTSLDIADGIEHKDTDCAWDAVGNIYYIDALAGTWRVFSPPGTNQATTVAVPKVQVSGGGTQPFRITHIGVSSGTVTLDFTGPSSALPSAFTVLSGTVVTRITNAVGASIIGVGSGAFRATFATNGPRQFYRIQQQGGTGPQVPLITSIGISAGTVTVNFTGAPSDTPSSFTLLSGTVVSGITNNSGASIMQVGATGSGLFSATVAASGPRQFYRVRR